MTTQGSQYIQCFRGAPYEKDINMAEMIIGWLQWQRESTSLQDGFSDRGSPLHFRMASVTEGVNFNTLWYYMVFYDFQEGLDIGINWVTMRLGYKPWYLVRRDRSEAIGTSTFFSRRFSLREINPRNAHELWAGISAFMVRYLWER